MIVERVHATARGCILYDTSRVRKAVESIFDNAWWSAHGAIEEVTGGRASIWMLRHEKDCWVLRHYRRGGFIAHFSADRYFWAGESRCRSFAEWRLLAQLHEWGLPVPAPIAARYVRGTLTYTADLITDYLAGTTSLSKAMLTAAVEEDVWRSIGRTVAMFHSHGVHHPDLNAHNVLLRLDSTAGSDLPEGAAGKHGVYLLDFDRGQIRARGEWEAQVLARFRRSLQKISGQARQQFDDLQWLYVMEGYGGG
jgi:3-deoxy-D-manno-octulosonic acid kinase